MGGSQSSQMPTSRPISSKSATSHSKTVPSAMNSNEYSSTCSQPTSPAQDPHSYTDGRWLHQDELQRRLRYLQIDFPLLCETAIKVCNGASKAADYVKKEGGYTRAFILTMETGKRVVARIPPPVAGPPRLTTNSEVATITYLQSKTSLPIFKILAWNADPSNPVGIEYIIQEHADGCTKNLSNKIKEMAALDSPVYGNIYFSGAPIEEDKNIPLEDGFIIGPYCSPLYWNCGAGDAEIYNSRNSNRGPWRNVAEYTSGLIDTALSRLPNEQTASADRLPFRGAIQDHVHLINACRETMQVIIKGERVQASAPPTLIHPDYRKRNIYVSPDDPTQVTALIDWQLACAEPGFIYAHNAPDFAALPDVNPAEDKDEAKQPLSAEE
ncbi:hypothetical protein AJ80_09224 [Polytolypa hystricis UAMH7299]|uniref:Altered inheritance of mitochondria protein 9, mitochondrial n=1 Tax=Polytolypa hystricis (strain UAMH7299) TaxID=1447883 RepID=A0A2B7WU98_POLH7|nr:hypothetical protein AJ80_09224 [Polytolypa hystricis UAMH7299]